MITGIILLLLAAFFIFLNYLKKHNEKVKNYFLIPREVRTRQWILDGKRIIHAVIPPKTNLPDEQFFRQEKLYKAVAQGAQWIMKMQEPEGRFKYWYLPDKDIFADRWDDNFLRQAGTAYALAWVYQLTGDSAYLLSAQKNLYYHFRYLHLLDQDKLYYLFNSKSKTGGIALSMLAMLKIKEQTGTIEYDFKLQRLAQMLLYLQDYEKEGKFKSTYVYDGNYQYEKTSGWESMIYPGEAMLALEEMYRATAQKKYKDAFDKAVKYYNKCRYRRNMKFAPWTVSALCSMYEFTREPTYLDLACKLGRKMLFWQNKSPRDPEFGSFFGLTDVFSSTYLEAYADLIKALKTSGRIKEADRFMYYYQAGISWILKLQIDEQKASGFQNPELAKGGFVRTSYDPFIRIDNTQHSITAITKGLIYFK